ncbi:receptor-transporting protein 4-like [Sphaeramia orbicularis]|uniref:Receptor-transporting protein 4-like n=1 Tax=Sphaeramia orbicularis TaxID=375764 RepID=A0A672YTA6_9TELE|nr:receptor-transporting protein 4-like [Sphaeramia orbicularis]XP_030004085.1 receptor-transporting protein 4-like [Sphaeramia orbicularis]
MGKTLRRCTSKEKKAYKSRSKGKNSQKSGAEWLPSLWQDTFEKLLLRDKELDYGDHWTIDFSYIQTNTLSLEERRGGWKVSCHCTNGKFQCASCQRMWPSARVQVLFRYRLWTGQGWGTVIMRPFGQSCHYCRNDVFEFCGFLKRDVKQTLRRLFAKIRKNCYGEEDGEVSYSLPVCAPKAKAKPHESSLCEACDMGICSQQDRSRTFWGTAAQNVNKEKI